MFLLSKKRSEQVSLTRSWLRGLAKLRKWLFSGRTESSASRPTRSRFASPAHRGPPRPEPLVVCSGCRFDKSKMTGFFED